MFKATALFTLAKTCKQSKCPSIDNWLKKMWCTYTHTHTHIHTLEYYSAIRNEILPFAATWIDLENIILSDVSQKKTNTVWHHLYRKSKNNTNETIWKTK